MNPPPRKHRKSKPDSTAGLIPSYDRSGSYDRLSNGAGSDGAAGAMMAYSDDHFSAVKENGHAAKSGHADSDWQGHAKPGHADSDSQSFNSRSSLRGRLTSESSGDSRLVKTLLREGPKSAWSDENVEMKTRVPSQHRSHGDKQQTHERRDSSGHQRQQTSFQNGGFSPDGRSEIEGLLATLERSIETSTTTLDNWNTLKHAMEKNQSAAKADIERHKKAVKAAILKYVQSLNDELASRSTSCLAEADRCMDELENRIHRMKKIHETYSKLPGSGGGQRALGECIAEFNAETNLSVPENAECFQFHVAPKLNKDEQHDVVRRLLGAIVTSSRDAKRSTTHDDGDGLDATLKGGDAVVKRSLSDGLLPVPQLVATFTCRLKKDKRMCGVTDIALTDDGAVFVVDKLNKAIKLYDVRGTFEKCVGVGVVRKPSRVSYLPVTREVIVSDDTTKSVHAFTTDGEHISELINMRFPVGHCQTADGRIAVIEFMHKSVVIHNAEGGVVSSFATRMDCPAYITCTKSGHLVVTDWKSNCVNVFDVTGKPLNVWNKNLTGETFQPYGVCADAHGHVMVADRTGRDVICFHEDGEVLRRYEDEKHKIGMPFALACGGKEEHGLLAVAEYSGTVRLFRYLAAEGNVSSSC